MKGIVIYDSSRGHTRTIAETISETLWDDDLDVDAISVKDVRKLRAQHCDFIVLGSPAGSGTMSFTLKSFLGKLKAAEWKNKPFAVFDTENPDTVRRSRSGAADKIAEKLRDNQMEQVLPVLKTVGPGMEGQLVDNDIERARVYARELAARLASLSPVI